MAQTPQQRRANAKFAKDNESRMGKSEDQIKKRTKEAPKSPISPIWLGEQPTPRLVFLFGLCWLLVFSLTTDAPINPQVLLGFVVFGGIVFEVLSRMFGF